MSDKFHPITLHILTSWIFDELEHQSSVFGIPRAQFWQPEGARLTTRRFGHTLETPIGVAAGPHTQLAQNIVAAWLLGARFIELKTIQTLDELEVSKPCIDAEDVTYNCEWSQELRLSESFDEYLRAWVLLHALRAHLGWDTPGSDATGPGFVFNMSAGYNLEGIQQPNVQAFLDQMKDASAALPAVIDEVAQSCPVVRDVDIPSCLSNNITLSTMHGCPPDEIEKIGRYLIEERGLHTVIKLNPTLLGPDRLRAILNQQCGFSEITVPDEAFAHDTKYPDAVAMVRALRDAAERQGVQFGIKLTNTLEVENHRSVFGAQERMMYMSGRALHPLTVNLATLLSEEFQGEIPISISGGVDAFNLPDVLAGGLRPVTVCTDLLKPGGYARLPQYLEQLTDALDAHGARDLDDWTRRLALATGMTINTGSIPACQRHNLAHYANDVARDPRYQARRGRVQAKGDRTLGWFDCAAAPCQEACPAGQNIPDYLHLVATGRDTKALAVIRDTNPLPTITGCVCDHPCETRCVRNHYEAPLAIRAVKRFAAMQGRSPALMLPQAHSRQVAIIGSGPAGLGAAYYLALQGVGVVIYEAGDQPGGMASRVIPRFRLDLEDVLRDTRLISRLGVEMRHGQRLGETLSFAELREQGADAIVIATGAPHGQLMGIEGEEAQGVTDGLTFLDQVRAGEPPDLGDHVVIIGGGNSAMDAARVAWRQVDPGTATVLYRRTRAQMPADPEEIEALLEEGVEIQELTMPTRVLSENGRMTGLECIQMQLSKPDDSGRPRPEPIPGSEFRLDCSAMIVCISQRTDLGFLKDTGVEISRRGLIEVDPETMETREPGVFAGGDVVRGPATIIQAAADGRRIAHAILARNGMSLPAPPTDLVSELSDEELLARRGRRIEREEPSTLSPAARRNFEEVHALYTPEQARREAERCLRCNEMCNLCVTVCPNRANQAYTLGPFESGLPVLYVTDDGLEVGPEQTFRLEQRHQIVNITNFCNECGNCQSFCPTAGAPYQEKPRLHLDRASYEAETDRAMLIERQGGGFLLCARFADAEHQLSYQADKVRYRSPLVDATLSVTGSPKLEARPGPSARPGDTISLVPCAALFAVLFGVTRSLGHLFP